MGIIAGGGAELANQVATGSFTAVSVGTPFVPSPSPGPATFNCSLRGTFVGTARLERSFDGTNWGTVTGTTGTAISLTTVASFSQAEPEAGVSYRWNCTAYTSGTIIWRLSQ